VQTRFDAGRPAPGAAVTEVWNPELYRRFEGERTRPARELLARVTLDSPRRVYDLGCGPGNSTELLLERSPDAEVVGTDNSEAMRRSARERLPKCRFELSDIADWRPATPVDLVYSNAALQWVGDHETPVPHLFDQLASGGVLAIRMPDNREEATHRAMREVASPAPWAPLIGDTAALRTKILPLTTYYDLLVGHGAEVDVWRTAYQHPMASAAQIVEWIRATGLRPFVEPLPDAQRQDLLGEYEARIDRACPPRTDGRRLLAFPRLFIVARRPGQAASPSR
jgi:trans-aconitate 2-methyltransferase